MDNSSLCYNVAMKPVHIGLNAQLLSLGQSYRGAGISWYIFNLIKNLPAVSPDHFLYSVFLSDQAFKSQANSVSLKFTQLPTYRPLIRIFWEQFIQPAVLKQNDIDLLHALAFVAPVIGSTPFVVTIFDLSFIRFPEAFRPFNRWYLRHFTSQSANRARAVITISESTRRDVVDFFNLPASRVHTIYCGVDEYFRPMSPANIAAFRAAKNLPEEFVLFLGTLEPRKNVDGLIKAYARWRKADSKALPLVIAGGKGWYYEQIFRQVEQFNLTDYIRFPGYVPQEELPLWYNAATLFAYPSFFEGFGLPVLEAMACGTPVVTSTAASLPEVTGYDGTARLVPPEDTEALSSALAEISHQPDLRAHMSEQGLARAAMFSWQTTAQQTIALYERVTTQ
jgi:glycosyltransferase involved in cell wall biosynthesis